MARLGRVMVQALVLHFGRREVLRRLSDPFWFQSLGCVMGMDWHSSGITTSVMGALKRGLEPVGDELGIYVCGGRGRHSRKTPAELLGLGERLGLDGDALGHTSKLTAKVDSAALQDGFELYLHSFVLTRDGDWAVVQQGMNTGRRQARRYHWLSDDVESFVQEPHSAIQGPNRGCDIINLTSRRAATSREAQLDMVTRAPDRVIDELGKLRRLQMPAHHQVKLSDVMMRRLDGTLRAAADAGPRQYAELLMTPGLGARTVEALALVAEVIHGAPCRFSDPARFAFAHGGKDGHPFPVPLRVYDRTLSVLQRAVQQATLGNEERLGALKRLADQSRMLERADAGDPRAFDRLVARERAASRAYGGRTATGKAAATAPAAPRTEARDRSKKPPRNRQLTLPGM